jgi:hypothetical protein
MKKILFLLFAVSVINNSFAQTAVKPCVKDTFFLDLTGKIFSSVSITTNPDWEITVNCLMKATIETHLIFEPENKGGNMYPNLSCEINILKDGNQLYNLFDNNGRIGTWEQSRSETIWLDHINKNFKLAVQLKYCVMKPSIDAKLKMKPGSYMLVILQPHN